MTLMYVCHLVFHAATLYYTFKCVNLYLYAERERERGEGGRRENIVYYF